MKELVLYYSLGGKARTIAEKFGKENGCDIREVVPQKPIRIPILLCPKAMIGGKVPIKTIDVKFEDYAKIHIFAPIWANNPAPPIHAALACLPTGTSIALNFVSASGRSNKMCKIRDDLRILSHNDIKAK